MFKPISRCLAGAEERIVMVVENGGGRKGKGGVPGPAGMKMVDNSAKPEP